MIKRPPVRKPKPNKIVEKKISNGKTTTLTPQETKKLRERVGDLAKSIISGSKSNKFTSNKTLTREQQLKIRQEAIRRKKALKKNKKE